jgi:hypothetical protein
MVLPQESAAGDACAMNHASVDMIARWSRDPASYRGTRELAKLRQGRNFRR